MYKPRFQTLNCALSKPIISLNALVCHNSIDGSSGEQLRDRYQIRRNEARDGLAAHDCDVKYRSLLALVKWSDLSLSPWYNRIGPPTGTSRVPRPARQARSFFKRSER